MKKKATHSSAPHESLQGESAKQLEQIRTQIAEIKTKLRTIQRESVSQMQSTLLTVFDTQNAESLANLGKQAQYLMKQMDLNIKEAEREVKAEDATENTTEQEIYPGYDAAKQALLTAKEQTKQAFRAAAQGVKHAEDALNNLPVGKKPE